MTNQMWLIFNLKYDYILTPMTIVIGVLIIVIVNILASIINIIIIEIIIR